MKNIAFIMPNLEGGGAEKVLIDILNYINLNKYNITLILFERRGTYLDKLPKEIEIICIKDKLKIIPLKILLKFMKYFPKSFYRFYIKDKYDVEIGFMEGIATQLVANSNNLYSRKIAWVHADMLKFHWTKRLFRGNNEAKCYDSVDDIIFVCNGAKEAFETVFSDNIVNKIVINNPIISDEIIGKANEESINFNDFTIVSVGRLIPIKGYDNLIKAHAELVKKYKHRLVIIGDGAEKESLHNLVTKLKVESSVELRGFDRNPYKFIKAADLFVSSSISEGYSLVICESIILEKPVLATDTTGAIEILNNGEYGILCGKTTYDLKEALINIFENKSLLKIYKEKSITRKHDFDYKQIINKIENLIDTNINSI